MIVLYSYNHIHFQLRADKHPRYRMYYSQAEDGSAAVSGIPIAPFVSIQHQQIEVTTVNRLANYSLRVARERGWLQTEAAISTATDFYDSNDARPLLEQEGYAPRGEDLTVFYAGAEATLVDIEPHFRYPPIPSTMLLHTRLYVSHVGKTSYGLYGELFTYLDCKKDTTMRPLGTFGVMVVTISKAHRVPTVIPESRREILEVACAKSATYLSTVHARVVRLNVQDMLTASRWLRPDATLAQAKLQGPSQVTLPDGTTIYTTYKRKYKIRETDIDFNYHVNQLAMIQLIGSAFRSALSDDACVYSRLLNSTVKPLIGDLLLRKLRIDYVREIPMNHEAVEVYLYPAHAEALELMLSSMEEHRLKQLAPIGFLSLGVPDMKREERYVATVGILYCYV